MERHDAVSTGPIKSFAYCRVGAREYQPRAEDLRSTEQIFSSGIFFLFFESSFEPAPLRRRLSREAGCLGAVRPEAVSCRLRPGDGFAAVS